MTPIKGETFEAEVSEALSAIAAGLGDEYTDTHATVGAVARSKKGDGLLHIEGGTTRVVVEVTDSARTGWGAYLDEAERNRRACAALGLVRSPEQNGGHTIRTLGARRIVLAFDPTVDDHDLLRTVIMLLRAAALSATSRRGDDRIDTAEEKLAEAVAQLDRCDDVGLPCSSITSGPEPSARNDIRAVEHGQASSLHVYPSPAAKRGDPRYLRNSTTVAFQTQRHIGSRARWAPARGPLGRLQWCLPNTPRTR